MCQLLTGYRRLLQELAVGASRASDEVHTKIISIAGEIYNVLTKHDSKWIETAMKQTLKPV